MELRGSRVLLTGASGGLGAAIARELAAQGASLVLTARRAAVLEAAADDLDAEVLVADLADRADQERVCAAAADCDGVVANAGIDREPDFVSDPELALEVVDRMIEVNLRAPIVLAQRFAAARLRAGRPGAIALVGSLAGMSANQGTRMYCTTKFGLRAFSLCFAQELRGSGVTCSLVAPGFISEAGMHHDSGRVLPSAIRRKRPGDVGRAVVVALTKAPMEVFVAPTELRLGAAFAAMAPATSAAVLRRVGAAGLAAGPGLTDRA